MRAHNGGSAAGHRCKGSGAGVEAVALMVLAQKLRKAQNTS
jgi:hypothetical protein